MPEGTVKKMSLAVLVDQTVHWEGQGAKMHHILEQPSPEKLKSIRDLVAAATGFSTERGDQLIVESLPFESTLNLEPPNAGPAVSKPTGTTISEMDAAMAGPHSSKTGTFQSAPPWSSVFCSSLSGVFLRNFSAGNRQPPRLLLCQPWRLRPTISVWLSWKNRICSRN